ncbi:bifunctional pyr operon transcriptional regulator/uracil phosphoribosyltransferase PyrR [bacterium]|nr:MAG: bifunctional pyr operon transcriptional regulator/uracil phosphoribosyltransferase PyrR [bacterium]
MITPTQPKRTLLAAEMIERAIARMAHQIVEPESAQDGVLLIGIRRGGEALVQRLAGQIAHITGKTPKIGFLNVQLYRDDDVMREIPETEVYDDVTNREVIVVDDVLFTGRTVRSALDAVTDLGRPRAVRLAVLIDRGLRELPIQPDYVGRYVPTSRREHIEVHLSPEPAPDDAVCITVREDDGAA